MTDSILLVHTDPNVLRAIGARFEETGAEVIRELNVEAAAATLERLRPDVVLLSLTVPGAVDEALAELRRGEAPVLLFGDSPASAVTTKGLKSGALQVVDVGEDLGGLLTAASRAAQITRQRRLLSTLLAAGAPRHNTESLGTSAAMRQLAQQIALLAQSDRTTLLITGETGIGKGWTARLIHETGARAGKPFLEVRPTGLSAAYLESLLFGHERGVFVDATERKRGLIELADGGTLLLREIGDLPAEVQPKLLRVLETRSFRRVGGSHDITVDTRLMVTTRRNLSADVEAERFREDLFYRLSVMPLALPSLRERTSEDRHTLLSILHEQLKGPFPDGPQQISAEALERLLSYPWPGNVREMEDVLERSMIIGKGQVTINVEHLPGEFRARAGLGDRRHTPMTLEVLEHQHIERTLRYHGGNRTRAAKELGISRATLINKIKLYNITD